MSEGTWTKVGSVAGVVGALAACVALLPLVLSAPEGPQASPAPAESTVKVSPTMVRTTSATSGDCIDAAGGRVACGQSDSRLVVAAPTCTLESVRAQLGVPPEVRLELRVARVGTLCTVAPGPLAAAQGATGAQVQELTAVPPPDALVECASSTGVVVSCASPHTVEPVSDWAAVDLSTEQCAEAVRTYVGRPGGADDPLTAEVQSGTGDGASVSRCVVRSSVTLTGTVYRLAGARLPVS